MNGISICDIPIRERYIRNVYDTSTLAHESGQVHVKKIPESEKIIAQILEKCRKSDPNNIFFTIGGAERLGTVQIDDSDEAEYVIVLTVT